MIFLNYIELFKYLNDTIDSKLEEKDCYDIEVNISTYGINLSDERHEISNKNYYYSQTLAKDFIEKLDGTNTKMMVGIPPKKIYRSQSYGLDHNEYYKKAKEILELSNKYRIKSIPADNVHFKFYRIDEIYITGGINFGNSSWADCAVLIENDDDKKRLKFLFDNTWEGATRIHPVLGQSIQNII